MASRNGTVLHLDGVRRTYLLGRAVEVPALRGISLEVRRGEFITIVGPSGSGKTTLLNVAGLLDHADGGEITIDGEATSALSDKQRTRVRRSKIGFVFQSFNLLPHLTAEENVAMPLRYADAGSRPRSPAELLEQVGLGERSGHRPDELSGGEQQRVAIARALVLGAPILLADEPTGELDSETAAGIHQLLGALGRAGKTLIIVTHNEELARIADRSVHMRDGLITDDGAAAGGRVSRKAADAPRSKAAKARPRRKPPGRRGPAR